METYLLNGFICVLKSVTCTERLTGEISETQVAGYVVGEDGRAGVRGVVVDKAGPLIRNSLVGGFFSGMGQFFGAQQQKSTFPVSPLGQTQFLAPQQMLTAGVSQGASNALEKYADFFINRAEQLQPVLQVAAGREIDVVFTQGTKFGETTVRQSLSKIRNRSRKHTLQKLEDQGDSQSWLPLEVLRPKGPRSEIPHLRVSHLRVFLTEFLITPKMEKNHEHKTYHSVHNFSYSQWVYTLFRIF